MMLTSSRNLLEDGVVVVGLSVRWQYDASISQPASQSWPSLNQRCYHSLLSSIDVVLRPIVIGRLVGCQVLEVLQQIQHMLVASVHSSWPSWPVELSESLWFWFWFWVLCQRRRVLGSFCTSRAGLGDFSLSPTTSRSGGKERLPAAFVIGGNRH